MLCAGHMLYGRYRKDTCSIPYVSQQGGDFVNRNPHFMSEAGRITMSSPHLELIVIDLGWELLVWLGYQATPMPTASLAKDYRWQKG